MLLSVATLFLLGGMELICELLTQPPVALWKFPPIVDAGFALGVLVFLAVLAMACLTVGGGCLVGRSGIFFERTTSTVTVWWWLGRKRSTRYDLRGFAGVLLTDKPDESVSFFPSMVDCGDTGPLHFLYLTGPPGPKLPVAVVKGSRESAETFAEQVMSFIPTATEAAGVASHR